MNKITLDNFTKAKLRKILEKSLSEYGIKLTEDGTLRTNYSPKEIMKRIVLKQNAFVETKFKKYFACAEEINPEKIRPKLIYFDSKNQKFQAIYQNAIKSWSTPVSYGFGRRIRFLVWDEGNDKLMGIIALCDPIIGLQVRDEFIGWDKETKKIRLYNMMTAYVLGAVYPYNVLLGAKLVALLATSKEVIDKFREKYKGRTTYINKAKKIPELVAIDTMGAFGKSSIYNRLKGWKFVGYTKGQTHYHLSTNGFFEEVRNLMLEVAPEIYTSYKYGDGSNWKIRLIKKVLLSMDLNPENIFSLGAKRGYYIAPLAENWEEFLNKKTDKLIRNEQTAEELFKYWKERWFPTGLKRFERLLEEGEG